MTTGFTFSAKKGSSYTVRFLAAGKVTKLVSMMNSSPMHVGDNVATKEHIDSAEEKLDRIGNELRVQLFVIVGTTDHISAEFHDEGAGGRQNIVEYSSLHGIRDPRGHSDHRSGSAAGDFTHQTTQRQQHRLIKITLF